VGGVLEKREEEEKRSEEGEEKVRGQLVVVSQEASELRGVRIV